MVLSNYNPKIMFKDFPEFFSSKDWMEHEPEREEYENKDHMDFAIFSRFVCEKIQNQDFSDLKKIFNFIENCITGKDESIANAACTCFLENLINVSSYGDIKPEDFISLLGPKSKKYCKGWDEFTGLQTPGLWQEDEKFVKTK